MKFLFLGTSAGNPSIERNVTALCVQKMQEGTWSLFDCGEGTQHQVLRSKLSLAKLKRIFITHLHGDHCYGLFGLLTSRAMSGGTSPITIYGPKGIKQMIETVLALSYAKNLFEITFVEFNKEQIIYEDEAEIIKTIRLSHDVPSYAYYIQEKNKFGKFNIEKAKQDGILPGPIYKELQLGKTVEYNSKIIHGQDYVGEERQGRKIIIGGDNDDISCFKEYENLDLLIHESTHIEKTITNLAYKARHSYAKDVAQKAQEYNIKNLILTHFSPRFTLRNQATGISINEVSLEAKKYFNNTLYLAQDFDEYILDNEAKLSLNFRRERYKKSTS